MLHNKIRATIDKNISSIEFEVPVLFANNVIGKFNEFDGFVSLDLSNQNNNKALINVRIDSLDINYKRYKDLVISEVFFDAKKYPLGLNQTILPLLDFLFHLLTPFFPYTQF